MVVVAATLALARSPHDLASLGERAGRTPTSTPAPTATPTQEQRVEATVSTLLARLSLDDEIAQLIWVSLPTMTYTADVQALVEQTHVGGVVLYGEAGTTITDVQSLTTAVQRHAEIGVFVAMDEEGGWVDRLQPYFGPHPSAAAMAAAGTPQLAATTAATMAAQMRALGINVDFGPVVDVQSVPDPFEGNRLFGADASTVDRYAGAFLQSLQAQGVIGTLKHWPGIGSITSDPHTTLPSITHTPAQLEALDWAAFRGLMPSAPGLTMTTDVLVPAIDPTLPAELSPAVVGKLRDELRYAGVITTDALGMAGISATYSLGQAAVLALAAGNDMLLGASTPDQVAMMQSAIRQAIGGGRLTRAGIELSVRRVLRLKIAYGLVPLLDEASQPTTSPAAVTTDVPADAYPGAGWILHAPAPLVDRNADLRRRTICAQPKEDHHGR